MQQEGGEGHALHGGGTTRSAGEDVSTLTLGGNMFLYQNGEMWNTTMSVQYALAPNGDGDGGFCCIAGERHCVHNSKRNSQSDYNRCVTAPHSNHMWRCCRLA